MRILALKGTKMLEISEEIKELKEKVQLHQVCYEIWPEELVVSGQRVKVGFELRLCGTHAHGNTQLTPGCEKCSQTYKDLLQIAQWILPKEERPSWYEIEAFDSSLHMASRRSFQPEVELNLKILHRHGFDQPVDACEERCLKEMQEKLMELDVFQNHFHTETKEPC